MLEPSGIQGISLHSTEFCATRFLLLAIEAGIHVAVNDCRDHSAKRRGSVVRPLHCSQIRSSKCDPLAKRGGGMLTPPSCSQLLTVFRLSSDHFLVYNGLFLTLDTCRGQGAASASPWSPSSTGKGPYSVAPTERGSLLRAEPCRYEEGSSYS